MPRTLRVATFNVWDVRGEDLARRDHPRLARIAALVQEVRPDLLLLNEIAYDMPGAPGFAGATENPGSWWRDWAAWLKPLAGKERAARKLGDAKYQAIEPAPGRYVKERVV